MSGDELTITELSAAAAAEGVVVCDACPVLCRIRPGRTGACDRYGNVDGALARTDALVLAHTLKVSNRQEAMALTVCR